MNKNSWENLYRLSQLRQRIDKIDERIIQLLNERFSICSNLAGLKRQLGLGLIDLDRQNEVLKHVVKLSNSEFADLNKLAFSTIMVLSSICQLKID